MFRIEELRAWILVAFMHCNLAMTTDFTAPTNALETMSIKAAREFKDNWHGDTISPHYQSTIPSSDFYQKQILKQLILLNKKFDRMMIRMIGSTVRDEDDDDIRRIGRNDTQPDCESLIGTEFQSGIYHFDGSIRKNIEWIWNIHAIYCDQSAGGGWTVIQRRGGSSAGVVDFRKSWDDYAKGFGDLHGEFWLGNEWIHRLTTFFCPYELRVQLEDWDDNMEWAQYSEFEIGSKEENYRLLIGGYTGNATDSLSNCNSTAFSTFDRRNDFAHPDPSCTSSIAGGWWYFSNCIYTNLNGEYYTKDRNHESIQRFEGIVWNNLPSNHRNVSLKSAKMMIRLKNHHLLNTAESRGPR